MKYIKSTKKFKQPEHLGHMPGSRQYNDQINRCKPRIEVRI